MSNYRIYYSRSTCLNTQIEWEGRKTEGAYEVPCTKKRLLSICVRGAYSDEELEKGVFIRLGSKDRAMRERKVLLPIKAEQVKYIGGAKEVDKFMPSALEAMILAAGSKVRLVRDPNTGETEEVRVVGSIKNPTAHRLPLMYKTKLKDLIYVEVDKPGPYTIDIDKVLGDYKKRIDKLESGDVISNDDADMKVVGPRVGKKKKKEVATI